YRVEVKAALEIALPDQDAEVAPVPTSGGAFLAEPELDRLSNIIKAFNDQFGAIDWKDADKIRRVIGEEIPAKVAADHAYQNDRVTRRPHRTVQTVQRQPVFPQMA